MATVLLCIFLIIIGTAGIYVFVKIKQQNKYVSNWKKTEGKIISKVVGERKILPGTSQENYRIYLSYRYTVNGIDHIGNTYYALELAGGEVSMLERTANNQLKKIPETISIYYNPNDPAECYVKGSNMVFWAFVLLFSCLFVLLGLLSFFCWF